MTQPILITKATGEQEPFSREKLLFSLQRSGAGSGVSERVTQAIEEKITPGISTKQIYKEAFRLLRKEHGGSAARYNLKKALFQLGPQGYPFERYVARILEWGGYAVKVGQTLPGRCITHEVDVVAEKEDLWYVVECKFHNEQYLKTNVQTILAAKARFEDLRETREQRDTSFKKLSQSWVVTNTKFTSQAEQFGQCAHMELVSWNYPKGGSLRELIDRSGLHPVTALSTLTIFQKAYLLSKGAVLCRDLEKQPSLLQEVGVTGKRLQRVLDEGKAVCNT
ncbi:MAG: restriction endonuclease [bacterium]|nr:restriction endonuclease [bacterium]